MPTTHLHFRVVNVKVSYTLTYYGIYVLVQGAVTVSRIQLRVPVEHGVHPVFTHCSKLSWKKYLPAKDVP